MEWECYSQLLDALCSKPLLPALLTWATIHNLSEQPVTLEAAAYTKAVLWCTARGAEFVFRLGNITELGIRCWMLKLRAL